MKKTFWVIIILNISFATFGQQDSKIKRIQGKNNKIRVEQVGKDSANKSEIEGIKGDGNLIEVTQKENPVEKPKSELKSILENGYFISSILASIILIISFFITKNKKSTK